MASDMPDEKAIFNVARQIDSPDARREYLHQICGADSPLLGRVETLLQAYEEQASFLESLPISGVSPTLDQPLPEKPGTQIGPYKLLQQIGEGGMGTVFMAEQTSPVERRVALKIIIKPGMDTRQVIYRFEAERQVLAMMDHPNIAKVFDAGTTESGRPYFVMELVKGVPVTQYSDENHLTPQERLELFVPICQAIQHAHQKGIIHRDLKPTNILVARYDDKPVPKIIDFGVAKAVSQRLTEKTMFTQYGQIVGTVEYMSPEQAKFNQLDIDTRSDIYALGIVLYELLTGETPFDRERLRSAAFDEMLRIIREEEPSKPSAKLSNSSSLPSIAANRRIEPTKLRSMFQGELDWLVMKALEKDRARRYETASAFAADVNHYLLGEAVLACPPSMGYRLRKFARRNKVVLSTAGLLVVALTMGTIGTAWQAVVATQYSQRAMNAEHLANQRFESEKRARSLAEAAQVRSEQAEQQERSQRLIAERETIHAKALTDVVSEMFTSANPWSQSAQAADYTLREFLADAGQRVRRQLESQPELQAKFLLTLGHWQEQMGEATQALQNVRAAARILHGLHGEVHPDLVDCLIAESELQWIYFGDFKESERCARTACEVASCYPEDVELIVKSQSMLIHTLTQAGKLKEAAEIVEEARGLAIDSQLEGKEVFAILLHFETELKLTMARRRANSGHPGDQESARELLEGARNLELRVVAYREQFPQMDLMWSHIRLGEIEKSLGHMNSALEHYRRATELAAQFGDVSRVGGLLYAISLLRPQDEGPSAFDDFVKRYVGRGASYYWLHQAARAADSDQGSYVHICRHAVAEFANSANPIVLRNIPWICCLRPGAVDDWSLVVTLAERGCTVAPTSTWQQLVLAAVFYRSGDLKESRSRLLALEKSLTSRIERSGLQASRIQQALTWLFLGMIAETQGDHDDAHNWLEKVLEIRDYDRLDYYSGTLVSSLQLLRREAIEVIGSDRAL